LTSDSARTLIADRLACRRGGHRVFKDVSLRLGAGQALWLRGPNGCGKTSLLRILAGLAQADAGELRYEGPNAGVASRPAFVGHTNALKDGLRVHEALAFLCSLRSRVPTRSQLADALARFGLVGRIDAPVRSLSQGQRRKVALTRLWLDDAAIWLLDEPYDALDVQGAAVLDQALQAHLRRGGSVVMTSHQPVTLAGTQAFDLAMEAGR